ncbi:MAG: hypothetical protein S4CHLAM20_08760 [Chlamydiia bacterium]|nr:hypothetical protein [Chlamydiia bacterium]
MFKSFELDVNNFIEERRWDKFHSLKNVISGHVCEVAELLEVFTLFDIDKEFDEVKKEIGDVFITLFCIYRVLNLDIHQYVDYENPEKTAFDYIQTITNKKLTPELLVSLQSVKAGFMQESFLWIEDKESKNYAQEIPIELFTTPFLIALALCYSLNLSAIEVMSQKLAYTAKKYSLDFACDDSILQSMNKTKALKRGKQC